MQVGSMGCLGTLLMQCSFRDLHVVERAAGSAVCALQALCHHAS